MTIRIHFNEIKQIAECLLKKMESDKIDSVDIETDFYWIVTSDEWDDFKFSPNIAVGSLVDDWDSLQKILRNEHIVTYLDYDRFASILRAISETITPTKTNKCEDSSI